MTPDIVKCPLRGKIAPGWEPLIYTQHAAQSMAHSKYRLLFILKMNIFSQLKSCTIMSSTSCSSNPAKVNTQEWNKIMME